MGRIAKWRNMYMGFNVALDVGILSGIPVMQSV